MAMLRRRNGRSLRLASGLYACMWATTWLLGWDPLSVSPHGPIQEMKACWAAPASSKCSPLPRAAIFPPAGRLQDAAERPRLRLLPGAVKLPMVSAMTITKNGRAQMLDIALTCFRFQTYPSKEVVVVYDSDNVAAAELVRRHAAEAAREGNGTRVKGVVNSIGTKATLGELRNAAVAATQGELLIQWDDDDWYSAERIEMQYRALVHMDASACLLARYTFFEMATGLLWLNRNDEPAGTILATRKVFTKTKYHAARLSEDSVFSSVAKQRSRFVTLDDPSVYIRVIHSANSWDRRHFLNFCASRTTAP